MTSMARTLILTILATLTLASTVGMGGADAAPLVSGGHGISDPNTRIIWAC